MGNYNNIEKFENTININDIKVGDKVAKIRTFNLYEERLRYFDILEVSRITPKRTKIYYKGKACAENIQSYGNQFYLVTDELEKFSEENKLRYFLFRRIQLFL